MAIPHPRMLLTKRTKCTPEQPQLGHPPREMACT